MKRGLFNSNTEPKHLLKHTLICYNPKKYLAESMCIGFLTFGVQACWLWNHGYKSGIMLSWYALSRYICIFLQNFNRCSLAAAGEKLEFHSCIVSALHQTLSALTEDRENFHFCSEFEQPGPILYSTLSTEFINRSIFMLTGDINLFLQYLFKI